jgi:thioredoxin reductase
MDTKGEQLRPYDRRVLLATGMVDEVPELPGYRELWGKSIFQCPYCHGWEVRGQALGVLASAEHFLDFALFLTGWSKNVVVFTGGAFAVPAEQRSRLERAGVGLEERRIRQLHTRQQHLESVELEDGTRIARQVLFARPPQHQTRLVRELGLALDEQGFVKVDSHLETSVPGIHAAGDLTTLLQGALLAASVGAQAAYIINHLLNMERALQGG